MKKKNEGIRLLYIFLIGEAHRNNGCTNHGFDTASVVIIWVPSNYNDGNSNTTCRCNSCILHSSDKSIPRYLIVLVFFPPTYAHITILKCLLGFHPNRHLKMITYRNRALDLFLVICTKKLESIQYIYT